VPIWETSGVRHMYGRTSAEKLVTTRHEFCTSEQPSMCWAGDLVCTAIASVRKNDRRRMLMLEGSVFRIIPNYKILF